jgi:two-component system phosphate regulon response regulator OmpR
VPDRLLMIEDDNGLAALVSEYLSSLGFRVTTAGTAGSGLALLREGGFDALVLDVMLPDADGFEVCRQVRAQSDLPILMLTARGEDTDRIVGLELGADDYLAKPFNPRELAARLRAILRRRAGGGRAEVLRFGRLEIDRRARRAYRRGGTRADQLPVRPALGACAERRPRDVARGVDGQGARRRAGELRPQPGRARLAHPCRARERSQAAASHPHGARRGVRVRQAPGRRMNQRRCAHRS